MLANFKSTAAAHFQFEHQDMPARVQPSFDPGMHEECNSTSPSSVSVFSIVLRAVIGAVWRMRRRSHCLCFVH